MNACHWTTLELLANHHSGETSLDSRGGRLFVIGRDIGGLRQRPPGILVSHNVRGRSNRVIRASRLLRDVIHLSKVCNLLNSSQIFGFESPKSENYI